MNQRTRSPNYPGLSLREAIEKVRALHNEIGQNPTSRDVVAKGMGYSGLSGSSATAISAAKKYGLLEGRGEEVRISDRAMAILAPHNEAERKEAVRQAALAPDLFRSIAEKFPDQKVGDELLRNYLIRNKFSPQAVSPAIEAYRETMELVEGFGEGYDSAPDTRQGAEVMDQAVTSRGHQNASPEPPPVSVSPDQVEVGGLGFKGVGSVKIVASSDLSTEKALDMAETVISMMRQELNKRATQAQTQAAPSENDADDENEQNA